MKILFNYFEYKKKEYLLVGIIWIGISTPWMHGAITFVLYFFNIELMEEIRFIIGYIFIPIITVLWLIVFTNFLYREKRVLILTVFTLICITCEFFFFFFLITDKYNLIGYFERPFSAIYRPYVRFTMIFFLVSSLISFLLFARESIKSGEPELILKGKFLIIAFLTYTACAVLDSFFLFQPIIVVIVRLLLISSAIEFYFGWILPKPIKRLLLKEKDI